MTTKNDITGDLLKSKPTTKDYETNYDRIFGNKSDDRVASITIATNQPVEHWTEEDEKRQDIIGQNGNTGEHY